MGILEGLKGLMGGKSSTAAAGGLAGDGITSEVAGLLGQGGTQLTGLLDRFKATGLDNLTQSWIGKGANLPVSGDQIRSVLGSDAVSGIASKLGISMDDAASRVAGVLPQVIDKLTPDGVVPNPEALAQKLTGFLKH